MAVGIVNGTIPEQKPAFQVITEDQLKNHPEDLPKNTFFFAVQGETTKEDK